MPRWLTLATISGLLMAAQWSCSLVPASAADAEEGFKPIFNGKDLSGWQGEPGYWSVEDGAITGQTTRQKPLNHPTYMYWRGGRPHNFETPRRLPLPGLVRQLGHQFPQRRVAPLGHPGLPGRHGSGTRLQRHPL